MRKVILKPCGIFGSITRNEENDHGVDCGGRKDPGEWVVEMIPYRRWKNNVRLSNGDIELVVTLDVGPRIIHCGFVDGPRIKTPEPEIVFCSGHKKC